MPSPKVVYSPSSHPSHLVLFHEPSSSNTTKLSAALKVGAARRSADLKTVRQRASCAQLGEKNGVEPKVFERLGVASATLTPAEVKKLEQDDTVEAVVPNELRSIPPMFDAEQEPPAGPGSGDLAIAYLEGMRDAVEAMLRFHRGGEQRLPAAGTTRLPGRSLRDLAPPTPVNLSWCLELIGLTGVDGGPTGKGVSVAVLDTGIDLTHPDFHDRVMENDNAVSFISGQGVQDGNGHGTHCAGVVAGPGVSAGGRRYGVAPEAGLLVGKVLNNAGTGFDDGIIDGIDWAADMGAKVISMSLGSARPINAPFAALYERVASSLLGKGVLIVAAAGNSSNRPQLISPVENPAACPSILAVAAVDRNRNVAWFSCGKVDAVGVVDLSAPGVGVYSAWTGGGFRSISGTSMATPHVAGVAALYLQTNAAFTVAQLRSALAGAAASLGTVEDYGAGLVRCP